MNLSDDNKKEYNDNYFRFGVHKVQILNISFNETDNGKEFVEFDFCDPDNTSKTDTARVWFTTDKAIQFGFNTCRAIYVHNAPEDKKDAARARFDEVKTTQEMVELMKEKLLGKEMWFSKYYDPQRTYTNPAGEVKQSVNKNVYGYQPALQPELMPKDTVHMETGNNLVEEAKEVFTGAKEVDITTEW